MGVEVLEGYEVVDGGVEMGVVCGACGELYCFEGGAGGEEAGGGDCGGAEGEGEARWVWVGWGWHLYVGEGELIE